MTLNECLGTGNGTLHCSCTRRPSPPEKAGTGGSLKRFRLKEFRFRTCKLFVIMYLQHIEMNIEVDVNDFK